jgi:hypothetical protein
MLELFLIKKSAGCNILSKILYLRNVLAEVLLDTSNFGKYLVTWYADYLGLNVN